MLVLLDKKLMPLAIAGAILCSSVGVSSAADLIPSRSVSHEDPKTQAQTSKECVKPIYGKICDKYIGCFITVVGCSKYQPVKRNYMCKLIVSFPQKTTLKSPDYEMAKQIANSCADPTFTALSNRFSGVWGGMIAAWLKHNRKLFITSGRVIKACIEKQTSNPRIIAAIGLEIQASCNWSPWVRQ